MFEKIYSWVLGSAWLTIKKGHKNKGTKNKNYKLEKVENKGKFYDVDIF